MLPESQVGLGLGPGQVRAGWAAGRKGPGEVGKGAGAAWEDRGREEWGGGTEHWSESPHQGLCPKGQCHLDLGPVLTCTSVCGSQMVLSTLSDVLESQGVRCSLPAQGTEAHPPAQLTALRAKHCCPEPPWGQRACGLVVSLDADRGSRGTSLASAPAHVFPTHHHHRYIPGSSEGSPSPWWLFNFLRLNVERG